MTNNVSAQIDYATEVKTDRLAIMWKVTAASAGLVLLFSITLINLASASVIIWMLAPAVLIVFCLLTRWALKTFDFETAASLYVIGGIAAISVAMMDGSPPAVNVIPFAFVPVVFTAGLLLHPQRTFIFAVLTSLITIFLPYALQGSFVFLGVHQVFVILLTFLSALIAAQVTGELYAVTEWALMNYNRERRTNTDLFENRAALQKSLQRSEALGDQLQETNLKLAETSEAAEAAKNFRGQFLANMSHELRTPLNAIIGFSETMLKFPMMYDDVPLPDSYKSDLNQIYTSGRQLLHLINDILDLAKVDAGKLEVYMQLVELKPIIDSVLTTAKGLVNNKPIELLSQLPDPLPQVWADEMRVRQVLLNLYSNATKFTNAGTITLRIAVVENEVIFSVADTGPGIPPDQQGVIFEEFKQAQSEGRDPRSGAGLGLAISRQLLDLMGGRIWVESTLGQGSTFYFALQPYHKEKLETIEHSVLKLDAVESIER